MANNLTMLVLEIVLVQLLLACALALMCTLPTLYSCIALSAGNWAHALHIGPTGVTYPWRGAAWSKFEVACRPLLSTR